MPPSRKDICDCRTLERASKEPDHPIRWDERLNEYHIVYGNGGQMMVYYCPFCGGATPKSRRASLFADVTHAEERRICELFDKIRTVADVISRFGPPDEQQDCGSVITQPERDDEPGGGQVFRTLLYKSLSPVANIVFEVGTGDLVRGTWRRKYKGDNPA